MNGCEKLEDSLLDKVSGGVYEGSTTSYIVVKGDTLESVARRFYTDVKTIKRLNSILLNRWLRPGELLVVPNAGNPVLTVNR